MAAASAARGHGAAQEPQAEPARGVKGARGDWARDWHAIPDPLGNRALPLVMEVYGWLGWASSGTTRGMRNRPLDAVLLRRDGKNWDVLAGGWMAQEDRERVLRAVILAGWPNREPTWPAFLGGGGGARRHGRRVQQLAPPGPANRPHPLALLPEEPAAAAAPAPTQAAAQVTAAPGGNCPGWQAQGGGNGPATRDTPAADPGHPTKSAPPPASRRPRNRGTRATHGKEEGGSRERADTRGAGTPPTRRPLITTR